MLNLEPLLPYLTDADKLIAQSNTLYEQNRIKLKVLDVDAQMQELVIRVLEKRPIDDLILSKKELVETVDQLMVNQLPLGWKVHKRVLPKEAKYEGQPNRLPKK